jgi:hypothetical protein
VTELCSRSILRGKIFGQAQHSLVSVRLVIWVYHVWMFIFSPRPKNSNNCKLYQEIPTAIRSSTRKYNFGQVIISTYVGFCFCFLMNNRQRFMLLASLSTQLWYAWWLYQLTKCYRTCPYFPSRYRGICLTNLCVISK